MSTPAQQTHPSPQSSQNRPGLGIGLKITSVLIFLVMASLLKASGDIPSGELVFFRSLFALPPILIFLAMRGELSIGIRTSRPWAHLRRGLVGATGMSLNFFALTQLPLPEATTIGYATPLVIVVLSALILKETVRIYRWSAIFLGMIGVGIIVSPRLSLLGGGIELMSGTTLGAIAALCGTLVGGFAALAIRDLTKTERSATIVLFFSITTTTVSLATIPFGWVMPTPSQAIMLVLAGTFGGIAQILMTECYRHADMSVVAPFDYSSLVFSILIGLWIFGEVPTWQMLVGSVIVVAAGIFIIYREHALGIAKTKRDHAIRGA